MGARSIACGRHVSSVGMLNGVAHGVIIDQGVFLEKWNGK